MAFGAAEGGAEPSLGGVADPVGHVLAEVFEGLGAAFLGLRVEAVVARGDAGVFVAAGDEVAGELFAGELVEGLVVVEGADDVVAVGGDGLVLVAVEAGGATGADDIHPVHREAFAKGRRSKQFVGAAGEGVGRFIGEIFFQQRRFRRQAGEVEGEAADELFARGGGAGGETGFLEAFGDQDVGGFCGLRRESGGAADLLVGPVIFVFGALADPFFDQLFLPFRQDLVSIGRWHEFVLVVGEEAFHRFRFIGFAGDDGA